MTENRASVGKAIASALERAEELRRFSDRPARVRIVTLHGDGNAGLTIHARIAARSPGELRAQLGIGTRCIPWDELDARAGELVGLVDTVVGEVTLAVQSVPPAPRPSRSQADGEIDCFDALTNELGETLARAAMKVLDAGPECRKIPRGLVSEATMLAALKLAALSAFTADVGLPDIQDELKLAVGDVMRKMAGEVDATPRQRLDS